MKKEKQRLVLAILATCRYKVEDGKILSFRKGEWSELKYGNVSNGYQQVSLFNGRRVKGAMSVVVLRHIVVYLAANGEYAEGMMIIHKDKNPTNFHPDNLQAVSVEEKKLRQVEKNPNESHLLIRTEEIASIRKLHGEGKTHSSIARELGLLRTSVRYIIKKIEQGLPLKYENYVPKYK